MGNVESTASHTPQDTVGETIIEGGINERREGVEGLRDLGFEYRFLPCDQHSDRTDGIYAANSVCFECATSLYHTTTGIRISQKNRKDFVPDGRKFDDISACCQEIAQELVQRDCELEWVTLSDVDAASAHYRAPVCALRSSNFEPSRPTMLIVTGKGVSRAGILSARYILEHSIEVGSALFYIVQAKLRGCNVVLLDPNAWGADFGKDVVEISLNALNFENQLFVLAHSAAGGYVVRYVMEHPQLLRHIQALAFTDSTHNVQWTKNDDRLYKFLQSQHCLYVRNNSEKSTDTFSSHKHKESGEVCNGDRFWKQRFGDIPTVWAGTTDHSLMCFAARNVIMDFFDARRALNESM